MSFIRQLNLKFVYHGTVHGQHTRQEAKTVPCLMQDLYRF